MRNVPRIRNDFYVSLTDRLMAEQPYLYSATEYARPWKLFSLFCGIAFLVIGALFSGLPDWDIPVSFLMAGFTYFTAPCSLRVIFDRRWKQLPHALFWTWFSVDGSYTVYWATVDPEALIMRPANAGASLALYGMCALVWLHRGTLRQLVEHATVLRREQH
ncbi:MAG TPA: hypothetical protein PLK04_11265 [Bacillota bacterium]|nr:hypothetical protein [Bacillota bacterium]